MQSANETKQSKMCLNVKLAVNSFHAQMKFTGLVWFIQGLQAVGLNINKRWLSAYESRAPCAYNLCVFICICVDIKYSRLSSLTVANFFFPLFP